MKRILGLLLLIPVLFSTGTWAMGEKKITGESVTWPSRTARSTDIRVDGMVCAYCAFSLQKNLEKKLSKDDFEILVDKGVLRIKQSPLKVSVSQIETIIRQSGFTPRGIVDGKATP